MDELGAGIAQSRRTVALIKVRSCPNPCPGHSRSQLPPGSVRLRYTDLTKDACAPGLARPQ